MFQEKLHSVLMERCLVVRRVFIKIPWKWWIYKRVSQTTSDLLTTCSRKSSSYKRTMCLCNMSIEKNHQCFHSHADTSSKQHTKWLKFCGVIALQSAAGYSSLWHKNARNYLHSKIKSSICDRSYSDIFRINILKLHTVCSLNSKVTDSKCKPDMKEPESSDSESDLDPNLRAALDAVTPNTEPPHFVNIVPGKGPPPDPPLDCCMSGCANCVWIQYCEDLKHYFADGAGNDIAREAIDNIENEGLKMFLKVELGFI